MVRYKCRWVLFELVQDPILQNDKIVEHNTPLRLTEQMIQKTLRDSVLSTFGDYGSGLLRSAHGKENKDHICQNIAVALTPCIFSICM